MNKKIVFIGEGCWFPDSLLWFKEQGFDMTVISTKQKLPWFKKNYNIFREFGAKIIDNSEENLINIEKSLDKNTLLLGGGNFGGDCPSSYFFEGFKEIGLVELDILWRLSKYNFEHNCGAVVTRYFNGDTGFASQYMVDLFNEKIKYVDFLMFDNSLLCEFVLSNIPVSRMKKTLLGCLEVPLKRFVCHNTGKISKKLVSLGRNFCSSPKVLEKIELTSFPIKKRTIPLYKRLYWKIKGRRLLYSLAGGRSLLNVIYRDRKLFTKFESSYAFGLSHMYDIFSGSIDDFRENKDFYFSILGQKIANPVGAMKEAYYPFTNNPNKDVCYLMNGIIPLISHVENTYYKALVDKKMAILIQKPEDISAVLNMSDEEIQQYRDNIYNNQDLFTFDKVGEKLCNLLDGNKCKES